MKETLRSMPPAAVAAAAPLVQRASAGVVALFKYVSNSDGNYLEEGEACTRQIRQQLAASDTETKLKGLRRALAAEAAAATAEGTSASRQSLFFPDVLKNLETSDFELKRLVYLYLVEHSSSRPDLTLLAINGLRKDLFHRSHVVRAFALKALSSLQLLEILQFLLQSVRRAAVDTSPLVRKTAAHAAAKVYFLDKDLRPEVLQLLIQLLQDGELAVLGAAAVSFRIILHSESEDSILQEEAAALGAGEGREVEKRDLQVETLRYLHPVYRRLVSELPQLQSAAQVALIDLLTRYCRAFFRRPEQTLRLSASEEDGDCATSGEMKASLAEDFYAFYQSLALLLHSDSPAVVVSTCAALYSLFPPTTWEQVVIPLIRTFSTSPPDCRGPILSLIFQFALVEPSLFAPHFRLFFLKQGDSRSIRLSKLRLLLHLCDKNLGPSTLHALLQELEVYVHWTGDPELTTAAFGTLKILAMRHSSAQPFCLRLFLQLLDSSSATVASEAVIGVRSLLQHLQAGTQHRQQVERLVLLLAAQLQRLKAPAARASVVWIIGRYHYLGLDDGDPLSSPGIAEDALRQLTKSFASEGAEAKAQVMMLALRLWYFHKCSLKNLKEGVLLNEGREQVGSSSSGNGSSWIPPRSSDTPEGTPVTVDSPQQPLAEEQRVVCLRHQQRLITQQHNYRRVEAMLDYLLRAASFDSCFDVRDLARLYAKMKALASMPSEASVDECDRDMRLFALQFLQTLAFPPSNEEESISSDNQLHADSLPSLSVENALSPSTRNGVEASTEDRAWLASSLSAICEETGSSLSLGEHPGATQNKLFYSSIAGARLPLPAFAETDTDAALRQPPTSPSAACTGRGDCFSSELPSSSQQRQALHSSQSISSADATKTFCAAELMGRKTDGSRMALTAQDLEAFLQADFSDGLLSSSFPLPSSSSSQGPASSPSTRAPHCGDESARVWDFFEKSEGASFGEARGAQRKTDEFSGRDSAISNFVLGEDAESDEEEDHNAPTMSLEHKREERGAEFDESKHEKRNSQAMPASSASSL